jgi:hypothetical protein
VNIQSLYPIFKTVHILSMSTSVIIMIVGELLLVSGGYLQAAPALYRGSHRLSGISEKLGLLGLIAGVATALTGGWGLFPSWLILAYTLIILTFVLGKLFVLPWKARVEKLMANPAGVPVAELQSILRERRAILGRWLVVAVFIGIVMVMRLKPSIVIVPPVTSAADVAKSEQVRFDEPSVIAAQIASVNEPNVQR